MPDKSKNLERAQDTLSGPPITVELVASFIAERVLRGDDIGRLIHAADHRFPNLRVTTFIAAFASVTAKAGPDAFPTGRKQ
jgi:hypothetical protein